MADPLSITASLIAVGQVVGSIIVSCYNYQERTRNAGKSASRILLETRALRHVTESLLANVIADESRGDAVPSSLAKMIEGEGSLFKICQKDLVSLEERLQTPVNKWKRLGDQLLWPLRESEIAKEVENIHRMRSIIESGLAVDTAASIREIQKNTRQLMERTLDFGSHVEMTDTERLQLILTWLGAFNPSAYHNMVRKDRTEGTGAWLFQSSEFERWRESTEMTILWMHGIPGCGKTVLTSSVIDHIWESTTARDDESSVAYYYFQFGHQDISIVHSMLRSLISQLSFGKAVAPAALDECALRHFSTEPNGVNASTIYVEGVSQPTTNDLVSVLRGILAELDDVYLVIDGFDECMDQDDLLHLVDDMLKWNSRNLHVFVTGRYHHELDTILEARKSLIIEMDDHNVDSDIQLFIQQQLASHPKLRKWPPRLRAEIHESLTKGSKGMFRWVSCQIEVIAKCITPRDLARALKSLPKSLSAAYTSILAQVDEFHWEYATKILLWLAVSSQPLLIEEAVDGLAIDLESDNGPGFDPDLRIQDVGDVIDMCATLVTPCKVHLWHYGIIREFIELRLAHHTVKEYLLSDFFQARLPHPVMFAGTEGVHEFVATISIAYLLALHEPLTPESLDERPLSRRAAQVWLGHYIEAEKSHGLASLAIKLLKSNEPYKNWCRLCDPTRPWRAPNFDRESFLDPLYYVSNCGVEPLVSQLLQAGSDPATKGEIHGSCLQSAVYNGHSRVVEALLDAGADPNVGGGYRDCPLSAAVDSGQNEILTMLLKHGADPDGPDFGFTKGNILLQACRKNNTLAVELLINAGASPNHHLRKVQYSTPLEFATYRGFQECMRLVLPKSSRSIALRGLQLACKLHGTPEMLEIFKDRVPDAVLYHSIALGLERLAGSMMEYPVTGMGVDRSDNGRLCEIKDYSRAGALYCACEIGNLGLVQKLVQDGVDVNVDDECFGPSLAVAAYQGHIDVVKFLIDSGASLKNCNGTYGGPAQAAILGNHREVLELLVSAGADINMPVGSINLTNYGLRRDLRFGSPLQAATFTANDTVVEWLLEHGADVNYGGGCGAQHCFRCGPPLSIASSHGIVNLVDRLLQVGAEVNQRTERRTERSWSGWSIYTSLEAACLEGHINVAERLIQAGAAINFDGEPDQISPHLACAVEANSQEIVDLLLRNGANPNSLSPKYREDVTVLAQACMGSNPEIVSTLIEAGADVLRTSRFADEDEPPIQTAARNGNVDVIRALLKKGANVNGQTIEGFTALHKAARRGCAPILRVLLSEGLADYSLRLINGSQPIHSAARWNHPDCMQVLVEAGADINSQNHSGKTPLHWATVRATEYQETEAIEWLLSNGADAGLAEHGSNLTPYDYAALWLEKAGSWGKADAIKILELFE